jgi:hypothetical protein
VKLYGLYSSFSSLILSGNDELKFSLRQSSSLAQLMLTGYRNATGALSVEGVDWLEQMLGGGKLSLGVLPSQEYCHGVFLGRATIHYAPLNS